MANVKIYSTPVCPYCIMAKKFLDDNGIQYENIDVSTDKAAVQEMMAKSGQLAVPVIDIDGKVIIGFNVPAIKAALGLQ
jgi:glutaredoxin-like YruB-family protein